MAKQIVMVTRRRPARHQSGGRRGQCHPWSQGSQRRSGQRVRFAHDYEGRRQVAKEIELKDPLENMGAQMVREVASKTSDVAGDGTTAATVLAQAIYREGAKNIENAVEAIVTLRKAPDGADNPVAFANVRAFVEP